MRRAIETWVCGRVAQFRAWFCARRHRHWPVRVHEGNTVYLKCFSCGTRSPGWRVF